MDNWHSGNIVDNRELINEMKRVEKKKKERKKENYSADDDLETLRILPFFFFFFSSFFSCTLKCRLRFDWYDVACEHPGHVQK